MFNNNTEDTVLKISCVFIYTDSKKRIKNPTQYHMKLTIQ